MRHVGPKKTKKGFIIILTLLWTALSASCAATSTIPTGDYFLDGEKSNAYIQIISQNKMKLVNFDADELTNYLIREGTGLEGKDAEDFMERHNLPDAFYGEIVFEFNQGEKAIYVKALSHEDIEYPVVNYRMIYESDNTITFMENTYTRYESVCFAPHANPRRQSPCAESPRGIYDRPAV